MSSRRTITSVLSSYLTSVSTRLLAIVLITLAGSLAHAHEIRPAIVDLQILDNATFKIEIRLNLEAIIAEIGPEHNDTSESKNAQRYQRLRAMPANELRKAFHRFESRLVEGISLQSNLGRLYPRFIDIEIPAVGDLELARDSTVVLGGEIPAGAEKLTWGWNESFGANALRVSSPSKADLYTVYLQRGDISASIPLEGIKEQSVWQVFANYTVIGFHHIIPKGLDHILFVVGLFLLSMRLGPLLWQITSFTIAHSVTLALGILGIVQIPASIVEPLIALSIVYVCVENILSDKLHKWRTFVIFSFGLLHGLGFASVLSEIGLNTTYFITGLIAFNLGLELGQLAVILFCFTVAGFWFRHKEWYRQRITIPASAVIASIGVFWFIERTFI